MWRWEDEILADLNSKEPEKIAAGLRDLKTRMDDADEFSLAPFGLELLNPFGEIVSEETQSTFLSVITTYHSFSPPLSEQQMYKTMVGLVLRYGDSSIAYRVALELKVDKQPVAAVAQAMQEVSNNELSKPQQIQGTKHLILYLLDGTNEVRQATIESLADWSCDKGYREVIQEVIPELTEQELRLLKKCF
ncbi:MAG TPA: hypothetical protein V6D50_16020 [Chroococcales cyanobacterium]|jgi:hypothetical protein